MNPEGRGLLKARKRLIWWWVAAPFVLVLAVVVTGPYGSIGSSAAMLAAMVGMVYLGLHWKFFCGVWGLGRRKLGRKDLREWVLVLAVLLFLLLMVGAQFAPLAPEETWDGESALTYLLAALFVFYLFHCWLSRKWQSRRLNSGESGFSL